MRNVALLALGFFLLVAQATFTALVHVHPFTPNLLLPVVIYLGVSQDVELVRGAALSFVLGYLLDSFGGSPMGLQTFVLVAVFLLARGAGFSLFLRGPLFQIGLTFVVGLLAGGTVLALRAIFEQRPPFPVGGPFHSLVSLLAPSFITAILAPLVFLAVRRVDAIAVRRPSEGSSS